MIEEKHEQNMNKIAAIVITYNRKKCYIWCPFVAQRVAWTYGWPVLFHSSTVWQEKNDHNLMKDFSNKISGYLNNSKIYEAFRDLKMKEGIENISENMLLCYWKLIEMDLVDANETGSLNVWLKCWNITASSTNSVCKVVKQ
jgi:hypothetical protein